MSLARALTAVSVVLGLLIAAWLIMLTMQVRRRK